MAAIVIQSTFRMYIAKKYVRVLKIADQQARKIQKGWHRFETLLNTRNKIANEWQLKLTKWRTIQKDFLAVGESIFVVTT